MKGSVCLRRVAVALGVVIGCGASSVHAGTLGDAVPVPGRVEAEGYVRGREGIGFHVAHGDWGDAHPRADSMDISGDAAASGGYGIGWIEAAQWFVYDLTVSAAGQYTVAPVVNAPWQPGALHVEIDGANVTGTIFFGTTSGFATLPDSTAFALSAGTHRMRVVMEDRSFDLDAVDVKQVGAPPPPPPQPAFLRGVNFGGQYAGAVTVGGYPFATQADAQSGGLSIASTSGGPVNAWQTAIAASEFTPAVTDPGLVTLLNAHVSVTNDGLDIVQAACNGNYLIYTYQMENNASNSRSFRIDVQGTPHDTVNLAHAAWQRFGPYSATVSDATAGCNGRLRVQLVHITGDASIMGMEIYTTDGGSLPAMNGVPPAGYTLVFSDEFNGTTLDRTKWYTKYINWGGTLGTLCGNGESQWYTDGDDTHIVSNGTLKLTGYRRDTAGFCGDIGPGQPRTFPYASGMIRSVFTQTYGYWEARVKVPRGAGMFPAFWMLPEAERWPPEIDIFEFSNNPADQWFRAFMNIVRSASDPNLPDPYRDAHLVQHCAGCAWDYEDGTDFTQDFHVYGLEWFQQNGVDYVTHYLDGKKIVTRAMTWTYDDGTAAAPAHVMLNLAMGSRWSGPVDDTALPQALEIDYVRVYAK